MAVAYAMLIKLQGEMSEEESANSLISSSTMLATGKLEQMNLNTQAQSVYVRVSVDSRYRNTNMRYVDGAVAVLELLLTLVGLQQ